MLRTIRRWSLAALVFALAVQTSLAQAPTAAPGSLGGPLLPDWLRPTHGDGAESLEDRNGSLLNGDSLLDGPRVNNLGWFANVDLGFMVPHVNNQLSGTVTAGSHTDTIGLRSADLNWTISPRFEVGYRFGEAAGELLISYRFLASDGTTTTPGFDTLGKPGSLHSRFDMNVIDLDYASQENSLFPWFEMKWRVGVRMASLFFDSEEGTAALEQHISNHFAGAGPHVGLELWHPLLNRRAGLYCKVEGASVLGEVDQRFEETVAGVSGVTRQSQFMPTFMLGVEAGFSWTPNDRWRFTAGYSYEHWWDVAYTQNSRGDVMSQGIFLRGEWKY